MDFEPRRIEAKRLNLLADDGELTVDQPVSLPFGVSAHKSKVSKQARTAWWQRASLLPFGLAIGFWVLVYGVAWIAVSHIDTRTPSNLQEAVILLAYLVCYVLIIGTAGRVLVRISFGVREVYPLIEMIQRLVLCGILLILVGGATFELMFNSLLALPTDFFSLL